MYTSETNILKNNRVFSALNVRIEFAHNFDGTHYLLYPIMCFGKSSFIISFEDQKKKITKEFEESPESANKAKT